MQFDFIIGLLIVVGLVEFVAPYTPYLPLLYRDDGAFDVCSPLEEVVGFVFLGGVVPLDGWIIGHKGQFYGRGIGAGEVLHAVFDKLFVAETERWEVGSVQGSSYGGWYYCCFAIVFLCGGGKRGR